MHLGKEQEPGVSFSSSSCWAHPSTKLLFEDSGSFVLGSALQGNRARELKSIDAVCSCDCRMPSLTGVTFEWNLQAPLLSDDSQKYLVLILYDLPTSSHPTWKISSSGPTYRKTEAGNESTSCQDMNLSEYSVVIVVVVLIIFYGIKIHLAFQLTNEHFTIN